MSLVPQGLIDRLASISQSLVAQMELPVFRQHIGKLDADLVASPDYDDSAWDALAKRTLPRDQGETWLRCRYTVPEAIEGIPVAGTQLRVSPVNDAYFFAPIDLYIDGKLALTERSWMDFKCPEGIVSEAAEPGRTHVIVFRFDLNEKCYWLNNFTLRVIPEAVENSARQINSIVAELSYMERYAGAAPLIEQSCKMLEEAAALGPTAVAEAAGRCRALFEPFRAQVKQNVVHLIGHAHIDMNWFWSMEETRDIIGRDFRTVQKLMADYPELTFSHSQSATYAIAEELYPDLFAKIQQYEREGRWDVTASTWVEGDMNMSEGEAIVRHMLYSRRYLADRFEKQPKIMWCPDTFGHPGNLPQVLNKTGIGRYYQMRCGLNLDTPAAEFADQMLTDSRQVPIYWWKGVDGSRVLACNTIYNRALDARGVLRASARGNEYGLDQTMLVYGVGDHGGGPTRRDVEWVRSVADYPTMPTLKFSTTEEYYGLIEAGDYALPEREGEMNFVFEGCYTTHADIKRDNRLCEFALTEAEKLCLLASVACGEPYPAQAFEELWRIALFNQFHDILDGSGVKDTYKFTNEQSQIVLQRVAALREGALQALCGRFGGGEAHAYLAFNPSPVARTEAVSLEAPFARCEVLDAQGTALPAQVADGRLIVSVPLAPLGFTAFTVREGAAPQKRYIAEDEKYYRLSTDYYDIEIHKGSGRITTLYDRARKWYVVRREQIGWRPRVGVLNVLQIHMEEPTEMSAWTIGAVRQVHTLLSGAKSQIVSDGPAECRLRFEHEFAASAIVQDIVIHPNQPEILFETEVDWREWGDFDRDAPMLKVYFAPNVQNRAVEYETPFAVLTRPCDDNEYPALNWADIHDAAHGFALMNDSKHGYRCRGNGMELTLIRSGWLPDQTSDVGHHRFTYAILPHDGDWRQGAVPAHALNLNQPVRVCAAAGREAPAPFLELDNPNVIVSALKQSEDGLDAVIRLSNPSPEKATARLTLSGDYRQLAETDALERPAGAALPLVAGSVDLEFGPYEFRTFRIQ